MKINLQSVCYQTQNIQFVYSHADLTPWGDWSFLAPRCANPILSHSIWHSARPIRKFLDDRSLIRQMIETKLRKSMDPHSMDPVLIPREFQLTPDHLLVHDKELSVVATRREELQVILDYTDLMGQEHARKSGWKTPCHIKWSCGDRALRYPEPDFGTLVRDDATARGRVEAILTIMRSPGLYDGGTDFMFEYRLKSAIELLFGPYCNSVSSDGHARLATSPNRYPLLVTCDSAELTDDICAKMARTAHPTLSKLLEVHGHRKRLPSRCFVYGLHLSQTFVSIFVHFPVSATEENGSAIWKFCQVLIARHFISYESYANTQDDLLLQRWRLVIALFTILRHIEFLEQDIGTGAYFDAVSKHCGRSLPYRQQGYQRIVSRSHRSDLQTLRAVWRKQIISVPAYWIVSDDITINTMTSGSWQDIVIQLPRQLAMLNSYGIRKRLTPLRDDVVMEDHLSDDYIGPDFLHPIHSPRGYFSPLRSHPKDQVNTEVNTLPHLYKAQDFLAMTAPSWESINIFIANIFAGFSMYSVQWEPVIRYPFPVSDVSSDLCVVDFALAARAIPPTVEATIHRVRLLPLTISGPAILLCVRSTTLGEDGQVVSQEEFSVLSQMMEPHLRLFRLLRQCDGVITPPFTPPISSELTLLCVFIKKAFVHILAFSFDDNRTFKVSGHLLDSLPVSLHCEREKDVWDRMRIVIAMFTLQRQVVKICEGWNSICWPHDMLVDEHEAIVEVTGLSTPTPSADVPLRNEDDDVWDFDHGLEDDEDIVNAQIERSVQRVAQWFTQLEPSQVEGDSLAMDVYSEYAVAGFQYT